MIGQNMQPSLSQHPNVVVSLVGITNQDTSSKGPTQTSHIKLNCSKCRFTTKYRDAFERHCAQHAGVTFTCLICGHISYTKVESQRHTVQHSGKFPFSCAFCSYGAVRRDYVAKHVQRVHSKYVQNTFAGHFQGASQNVVIMGDVSIASVAEVELPTLINATEQTAKPPVQPLNIVPNLIPLTLNQPQGTNTTPTSYNIGGGLSQPVGIMPNKFLNPQCQNVSVTAHRDSLSTNVITNATNHTNISVTNNSLSAVNQPNYGGSKVLTSVNQATSIASDVISIIPKQSAHTANISNTVKHPARRAPPIILRKTQQRPRASAPNVVNKCFLAGSQPISSAGKVLTSLNQSTSVASNTLSVLTSQAIHMAVPDTTGTLKPSSFQTPLNITQKTHQDSTGMAQKPLYVYNGSTSVLPSDKIPYTGSQAFAGILNNSHVSVSKTVRQSPGAVSNQPEKRVSLASEIGSVGSPNNRFAYTVGKSLSAQSMAIESQIGNKPTATSLQSSGPLGNSLFDKTSEQGLCAPVQVELLEPLNQPIYEQTLTVSYPEEINIPPGSLVELVNMNTVNGAQELQLRILPQQSVGCSEKNAPETAPAVGTVFGNGTPTVDQALSGDKRHSNTQACPKTNSCQAPPISSAKVPQIPCTPTTRMNTCSEMRVTVKEEPPEHDSVKIELKKAHQSAANPVSQATCLPTIGITIRRKDHMYSSTSLVVPRSHNRISVTSNSQSPNSGGSVNGCKASATPTVTIGDIEKEKEGLPVILSVYSLGDNAESEQLQPLVDRRLLHVNSANNHGMCTPAKHSVDSLLVSCPPSKTLRQLLQKKGNCIEPPTQKRTIDIAWDGKKRLLQQPQTAERHDCAPVTHISVHSRQNDADSQSSDCLSDPMVQPTVHKPVEAHPPALLPQRCLLSNDPDAKERTICGVRISGFSPQSCKQLFTLVPRVSLARISDNCPQPATTDRKSENNTEDITLSAHPVLSCASNKQNISIHCHEVLKLRLKRKKCESEDSSSDIFEALAVPLTEANNEPLGVSDRRQRKDRVSGKRRKLSGTVDSHRLYLTPVKEDQPVKRPSPNQPVVVLNHPHPHVLRSGGERSPQSPADGRGIAPLRIVFFRDTHKVVTELVRSPSLKMKFKKVDGDQYQVTELLAEGISDKLNL
ncbi:hypothetical protein ACEWY4_015615 [Coilia grayii]|uniref:C2H2-type domain-containing protein n=1 Tax=Coilia grayii TaxID=363190 RepID=A0ABD1JPU7_9TELE